MKIEKEIISADALLVICKQRREKTAKELGYSDKNKKPYRMT